jgi:hypothetical protein
MKTFEITGVEHLPNGVSVTIDGFGDWGLTRNDVRVLRDGDHLITGSWPVGEPWCDDDWCELADHRVSELLDADADAARFEAIEAALSNVNGSAVDVGDGWVWVVKFKGEQEWSKRRTYRQCIEVVHKVVERLGEQEAFED